MALYNLSDINTNAAVVITCKLTDESENDVIILNSIEDTSIEASSTITEHPVVSGEMVADHMFKNPVTLSVRGSFQFKQNNNVESNLIVIQKLFERIKDEGVLCEIVKVSMPSGTFDGRVPRFLTRSNMALQSISWTEKISSLTYSFSFRQVQIAEIQEYDVDADDLYLPNVNEPVMKSFVEELLDWEEVDKTLYSSLTEFKLMTKDFIDVILSLGTTALISIAAGVLVASVTFGKVTALATSIAVACGASGPPGWIIGAAIAAVTATVIACISIFKIIKNAVERNKYRVDQFKKFENEKKMRGETERFVEFVDSIHSDMVSLDDKIKLFGLGANVDQTCILTLDDEIYTFNFTKSNTDQKWSLKVLNSENLIIGTCNDLSSALTDISSCTNDNKIFETSAGNFVYLFRLTDDESDLTSYCILHSTISMPDFSKHLADAIVERLYK